MNPTATIFLTLSIALLSGLLLSRLAKLAELPAVTAYLVAGVLIGPFLLGRLGIGFDFGTNSPEHYSMLSDLALGFIAFAIGNEFRLSQLKKIGKQATVIGIFQAVFTTVIVDIALIALSFALPSGMLPLPAAIILGAIATATAPAATLMVVRQYKAKGKVTDILLPVVALDDAVGLIVFAVSFGISKALVHGEFSIAAIVLEPILEIVCSLGLGAIMGVLFTFCEKFFSSNSKRLCLSITCVIFTVALSMLKFEIGGIHIGFSTLLVCMMLGTMFCNLCDFSAEIMEKTDKWTNPIFTLFFVLSGAELELSVFTDAAIVGIGVAYIVSRSIGKYFGAYSSAKICRCDKSTTKYLGITLLPQAGVALGMSVTAMELGEVGSLIRNIVLFSVLIYELVGPTLTKMALTRAGEIEPKQPHHHRKNRTAPAKV